MKKNIKLLILVLSAIISCSALVGCRDINSNSINISSEQILDDVAIYKVYQPDNNIKSEDINNIMEQMIKEYGSDKKGIMVYFYEYEQESKYLDINPYVVATWSSKEFDRANTQLNSKNNKINIKFSTRNGKTTEEQEKMYCDFLNEIKDETGSNLALSLSIYLAENKDSIEDKYGVDVKTFYDNIVKVYQRYSNDAVKELRGI